MDETIQPVTEEVSAVEEEVSTPEDAAVAEAAPEVAPEVAPETEEVHVHSGETIIVD